MVLSLNSFSQINWGSVFGYGTSSGKGITGQINFDHLEYKPQSRFERKVDEMSYDGHYKRCNIYIDKQVQKGKLTPNELSLAYYTKCRLYSEDIYDDWGFRDERGKSDFESIIYPYSESYPINHADTLIRYSKLLFNLTDKSSKIYKSWLGYVYNDMCRTITYGLDTIIENARKDKHYYIRNRTECEAYLDRIQFLKNTVHDFHPINWFALDLTEFRYKHSLGRTRKADKEKIKQQVSQYMLNYSDWDKMRGTALSIPLRRTYDALHGFDNIESELDKLLNHLNVSDFHLAQQLLKECPVEITNRFAEANHYDTTWSIVENESFSNTRLIDLRDSTDLESKTFSVFTMVEINYDIPNGDTIIINDVLVNTYWIKAELAEPIEITGKGSSSVTIKTIHHTPPHNRIYTVQFSSDDIQLVSNRGLRNVEFELQLIGQRKESP